MPNPIRSLLLALPLATLMTGCALTDTSTSHSPVPGTPISGIAMGGSQPITGAKVYLLAANPAGYGSASLSLLTSASTGSTVDSVGAYATTAAVTGGFNLAPTGNADYDCTQGYALGANTATSTPTNLNGSEQVYLYINGGNAGAGTNNSIGLLAALGPCNAIYSKTITVNELTTVAAAYAMAGYMTDATHLASPRSTLALSGLSNAGLNSANLVSLATGVPVANSTGITRPVATIYTLGDILAACVNGKSANSNCNTLFSYTQSGAVQPTETATAAINLAHNPWPSATGMTALYGLQPGTGAPFTGGLASQPNDFTVGLNYTGGGLTEPISIAIDGSGNAWAANDFQLTVSKFSSTGTAISPAAGFTGGGVSSPSSIAIDVSGNAWTVNEGNDSLSKFSSTGTAISPVAGYTGGGIDNADFIAIDGSGNVWTANHDTNVNSVSKLSSAGVAISPAAGYTGGGLNFPDAIAFDGYGNAWTANNRGASVSELATNGTAISTTAGYTGGGLSYPTGIAIDSSGNAWTANYGNSSVSKLSSTGTAISPSTGYTGGGISVPEGIAIDGAGNAWIANKYNNSISRLSSTGTAISPPTGYTAGGIASPYSIALDGSGDVWVGNAGNSSLTELIGASIPVVTPLAANITYPYSAPASKP